MKQVCILLFSDSHWWFNLLIINDFFDFFIYGIVPA